jgi:hypothetical protein
MTAKIGKGHLCLRVEIIVLAIITSVMLLDDAVY